jgi:hypothetical protein
LRGPKPQGSGNLYAIVSECKKYPHPFIFVYDHISPKWAPIKIEKELKFLCVKFAINFFKKKNF